MKLTAPLALFVALLVTMAFMPPKAVADSGKNIFLSSKCTKCHSVKAEGIDKQKSDDEEDDFADENVKQPPDLSDVGLHRNGEWLRGWLTKEITNDDGKKHKMRFKGEDEELDALVGWLSSLKKAAQ